VDDFIAGDAIFVQVANALTRIANHFDPPPPDKVDSGYIAKKLARISHHLDARRSFSAGGSFFRAADGRRRAKRGFEGVGFAECHTNEGAAGLELRADLPISAYFSRTLAMGLPQADRSFARRDGRSPG